MNELFKYRKQAGLTQIQVAARAGVCVTTITRFEKGQAGRKRTNERTLLEAIYEDLKKQAQEHDHTKAAHDPDSSRRHSQSPPALETGAWKINGGAPPKSVLEEWLAAQVRTFLRERGQLLACDHCAAVVVRVVDIIEFGRLILRVAGVKVMGE